MKVSDLKLRQKIGWVPHAGQEAVLASESRDIVICAGRRWGKSAYCGYRALKVLLQDNKRICIIAPTYDLAQRVFDYLIKWIAVAFPGMMAGVSMRPNPQIRTPWGTILECKSAENPTGILGQTYDLVIVDEASRIPRTVWETYVFPTTAQGGKSIFISTPFGKNWFYEKWLDVKTTDGAFHFTTLDNPFIKKEEFERARLKLPEQVFKQEYEAQFLDDAASVFRKVREAINDGCLENPRNGHYYILGVDLGKHEDFTVLTVIDKYYKKVVYWDRFREIDYPLQKERIIATAVRYNNARIILDSTGVGQPIKDDLLHEGLLVDDFCFTGKSKPELVEKLTIFIEQKHVTIPNNNILIDELEAFGYQLTDSGNVKYSAPQGLHDDAVMSLALAVWGLNPGEARPITLLMREQQQAQKYYNNKRQSFI